MKSTTKIIRRFLCVALTAVMLLGILPGAALAISTPFTDVPETQWYASAVSTAVSDGLVNGKTPTAYCPDDNLTYAETIKLAACMHQKYSTGSVTLENGQPWYQSYVDYAIENDIISREYNLSESATRAGYMEIFANALPDSALSAINDIPDGAIPDVTMSHAQSSAIYKLYRAGILQGMDSVHNCAPSSQIKRSEVATILVRMMHDDERISFTIDPSAQQTVAYIAFDNLDRFSLSAVPAYSGNAYVAVNQNTPYFDVSLVTNVSVEYYSTLDSLGRCGMTYACIGQDIMPTEERGEIGAIKPSGWQSVQYDLVDGGYLYNRSHLIGYQLTGENANEKNLITGTRYLNMSGMLPFENMVADYVKETGNHVAYRSTPIFTGNNLVADGVLLEGYSIEDDGDGICFCVFAYNVQPGITIDYASGNSSVTAQTSEQPATSTTTSYILNVNTGKFHRPNCPSVSRMNAANKRECSESRDELIAAGYSPCGNCNP